MRLLRYSNSEELTITNFVDNNAIPPYAILSHRWLDDTEEPTFEDLTKGAGQEKLGYKKLRFCIEQARQNGLQYFWVDTCCIDKADSSELSQAINSMFRWYRDATRCYVYLSDVSTRKRKRNVGSIDTWESEFRKSTWFTRGWTLQELLAPALVEFFSQEGKRLGDKSSLKQQLHEITGVPTSALQGSHLSQFSVNERFSWIERRETKVGEDKAYSLLGIFDVRITLRYGEGMASAFKRLEEEIDKLGKCVQDLRLTDPRHDKKRIEETKGGLLKDSYNWIFKHSDFQQWRNDHESRLLWIKGDPGKGKTMLLCGIIDELKKSDITTNLAYFFLQATDSRINNATAVLRGLIYLLVDQQPSLISHIRKEYDHAGKSLFEDANTWTALVEIITNILRDPNLHNTYLIIDALDECVTDLQKLLDFLIHTSSVSTRVKLIVSSRNWPNIKERLETAGHKVELCLELNADSVSTAVSIYIKHKTQQLAELKKYDERTRAAVLQHLTSNGNDTFLWVALVCQNLAKIPRWKALAKLDAFPPSLDSLYERMMEQISSSEDADLCKQILASTAVVYRPITLEELTSLVEVLEDTSNDPESLRDIVGLCGSLLTIREGIIYFVHQSAKDYLLANAVHYLFPSGIGEAHHVIFSRSLQVMSGTLRRDMYDLYAPGFPIERVKTPDPDPLVTSRYSCVYWVDHICDWSSNPCPDHGADLQDGGAVDEFLRKKYLYWLEALSLCRNMAGGIVSMGKLEALIQGRGGASSLFDLVHDMRRFIMYHKWSIETSPLQAYMSALLFSPARSLTRVLFKDEEPKTIAIKPVMSDEWSACLQTLEGHSGWVMSVAFSPDSVRLASASDDNTVKIWDAGSGECLQTLAGHSDLVRSVAFSPDSVRLASASYDSTVKIWHAGSGECLQTLAGHSDEVTSVAFSPDLVRLASASDDTTVKIWHAGSGECLQTLEGHSGPVMSVAFSPDSVRLASASFDNTVKIRDASSGECLQTLEGHSGWVMSVAFSPDLGRLASASCDKTVKIWDASSGECLQTLCIGIVLFNISFDSESMDLHTNIGTIAFNRAPHVKLSATDSQSPPCQRGALISDGAWITYDLENLVWLPSEYRPSCSAVSGKTIGIGVGSGRVLICNVEVDKLEGVQ
ncbi:uncharacterized protein BDZ99DRAFT_441433 [Mytilinidion resinicola]|uniref:NACHT domain-containing protein n=1 Tax=Mytilinidion resinicola TaxID=574789 RepID=A0A6A6YSF0_9PEZI|nr:uncharacterized protein BDZ99DRAFT_441433 [Mytilinidion resinicola]KAF2810837.1 hypothetical protein BDZ99DRAFT_441433 [Mytilinidion resinicola]